MVGDETLRATLALLDGLRHRLLRLLGGAGVQLMRSPELRVAVRGAVAVLVALVGTLCLPLWILAVGPLVLGVPHLLADVRYLVARPGHQRSLRLVIGVGLPLVICGAGGGMPAGLCALLAAVLLGEGRWLRKLVGALVVILVAATWLFDRSFYVHELLLAHLHNPIGVLLWFLWRPRHGRLHVVPLGLYLACGAVLAVGLVGPLDLALRLSPEPVGDVLPFLRDSLAPGLPEAWGTRLILLFCFAQMVHYSVWLQLVPDEDRDRPTPRTFRQSLLALRDDLSIYLLIGAGLALVGLVVWGFFALWDARVAYFRLAAFHGYLELCALGLWFVAGQAPRPLRPLRMTKHGLLPTMDGTLSAAPHVASRVRSV